MCEGCGGPSDELDHRLATNVARAMGPVALRRAFTLENLHWLCSSCHRRKTRLDRRLARFLSACSLDWRGARRAWRLNRAWAGVFLGPLGIVDGRRARGTRRGRTHRGIGGRRPSETRPRGTGMGWIAFSRADRCPWGQVALRNRLCGAPVDMFSVRSARNRRLRRLPPRTCR